MVIIKMKRKSVLDHHFCDFPLSSHATKIRRLQPQQEQPELSTSEPPTNDERALVLYKPPSSFTVDSNILSAIRDGVRWSTQSDPIISAEQNNHLAVVPWVPPQSPQVSGTDAPEVMDMEVEEEEDSNSNTNNVSSTDQSVEGGNVMIGGEELLQWQQQHCLVPQLPRISATPITWT